MCVLVYYLVHVVTILSLSNHFTFPILESCTWLVFCLKTLCSPCPLHQEDASWCSGHGEQTPTGCQSSRPNAASISTSIIVSVILRQHSFGKPSHKSGSYYSTLMPLFMEWDVRWMSIPPSLYIGWDWIRPPPDPVYSPVYYLIISVRLLLVFISSSSVRSVFCMVG